MLTEALLAALLTAGAGNPEVLPRRPGGGGGGGSPDFSGRSTLIIWPDLTAASGTRTNQGAAGSDCDLAVSGGDTIPSAVSSDGYTGADFEADDNDYLFVSDASCDESDTTGDVTIIMAVELEDETQNQRLNWNTASGNGWYVEYRPADNGLRCYFGAGSLASDLATQPTEDSGVLYAYHCIFDDTAGTVEAGWNGAGSGSPTSTDLGLDTNQFELSNSNDGGRDFDGIYIHYSLWHEKVPEDRIRWILSCRPDGSLCPCDGATYLSTGRYDDFYTAGLSGALPDCDDATF